MGTFPLKRDRMQRMPRCNICSDSPSAGAKSNNARRRGGAATALARAVVRRAIKSESPKTSVAARRTGMRCKTARSSPVLRLQGNRAASTRPFAADRPPQKRCGSSIVERKLVEPTSDPNSFLLIEGLVSEAIFPLLAIAAAGSPSAPTFRLPSWYDRTTRGLLSIAARAKCPIEAVQNSYRFNFKWALFNFTLHTDNGHIARRQPYCRRRRPFQTLVAPKTQYTQAAGRPLAQILYRDREPTLVGQQIASVALSRFALAISGPIQSRKKGLK